MKTNFKFAMLVLFSILYSVTRTNAQEVKQDSIIEKNAHFEKVLKDYADYITYTKTSVKLEEAKYIEKHNQIEKKIQDLYSQINSLKQQKLSLESQLSKECREYIKKRNIYHKNLKSLEKSTTKSNIGYKNLLIKKQVKDLQQPKISNKNSNNPTKT